MTSSGVMAMRRGRVAGLGSTYSRIAMVSGSMLASLLAPNSEIVGEHRDPVRRHRRADVEHHMNDVLPLLPVVAGRCDARQLVTAEAGLLQYWLAFAFRQQ